MTNKVALRASVSTVIILTMMVASHLNVGLFGINLLPHVTIFDILTLLTIVWIILFGVSDMDFYQNLSILDILVFLYVVLISFSYFNYDYWSIDGSYFATLIAIPIYFLIRGNHKVFTKVRQHIQVIFLIIIALESLVVILQFFSVMTNINPTYEVGGVWGHPAVTACSITICLPFLLLKIIEKVKFKQRNGAYILSIPCILGLASLLILESRTGILSLLLSMSLLLLHILRGNIRAQKIYIYAATIFVLLIIGYLSFGFKVESTYGRLSIWQNSVELAFQYPIFGHGYGSFPKVFNEFQALQVRSNPGNENNYLFEYVGLAYNDFLELFIEVGVLGVIFLTLILIAPLFCIVKIENIDVAIIASIVGLIPWMLTWSILKILPISILIFFVLSLANYKKIGISQLNNIRTDFLLKLISILMCLLLLFDKSLILYGRYQYSQTYASSEPTSRDILGQLAKCYRIFRNNEAITNQYITAVMDEKGSEEALPLALENCSRFYSLSSFIVLGNIYKSMQSNDLAAKAFMSAHYISPSKIFPKYCLIKLYYDSGIKSSLILEEINEVLSSPRKVESIEVVMLLEELKALKRDILKSRNSSVHKTHGH